MSFFNELKRRNVLRVAAAYVVVSWLVIQVAETIFPLFGFSDTPARIIVVVLAIGFIPVIVFAWAFELTPDGLKKDRDVHRSQSITPHTGKKLDRMIMVVLALALSYFGFDKFVLTPQRDAALQKQSSELLSTATEKARKQGRAEGLVESYGDKSIAVLPFVNMSDDASNEYFSDGISEELLNLLAKIPELRVISRSSAFSYKGKDIKLAQVAEELNVAHILEGSVRKAGSMVRITVQLIEARSDTHLWSDTYDRQLDDIFAIQDEIAAEVVDQLKITLLDDVPVVQKIDPEGYALYLRARHLSMQNTPESRAKAILLYQEALAIDPDYPPAWNGLATVYQNQGLDGALPFSEAYRLSNKAANRALSIDPGNAQAHAQLGDLARDYDGDLATAAVHYERALALEPSNLSIISSASGLLLYLGRKDDAIVLNEYIAIRDPVDPTTHRNLGVKYFDAGRLDEALDSFSTALTISPGMIGLQYYMGVSLLRKNEALAALDAFQQEKDEAYRIKGTALASYELGRQTDFEAAFQELRERWGEQWPPEIAHVYAWTGDADAAFEWLEKEYELSGESTVPEIVNDSLFNNIHDDSRWLPFLMRLGKSPEQLDAIKFNVNLPK